MPNSALAEIYFIAAMFILILIVCSVAVFFFFRTYKREKHAQDQLKNVKNAPETNAKIVK